MDIPTSTGRGTRFAEAARESQRRGQRDRLESTTGLHERYRKLLAKGKNKGVVVTAVGRELLGFIWAIGIQVETAQKESLQRAASFKRPYREVDRGTETPHCDPYVAQL